MNAHDLLAGRYRLTEPLGVGGMSVVWHAHDQVLGRRVAVKLLAAPYAADPGFRDRILAEAKAAALLEHPNASHVYDYGETAAREPFVVMEVVDGVPLAARLAEGPLPWYLAVELAAQTAAALSAAHARGLVHRDVTPANIMVTAAGAKVIDFGVAAVVGARGDGLVIGTPPYLAPERLAGSPGGPPADVYALGVVLYEALTGRLPWPARDREEIFVAHTHLAPDPLPPIPGLPIDVAVLIEQALAKDPSARPAAADVAHRLAAAAGVRVAVVDAPAPWPHHAAAPAARHDAPAGPKTPTTGGTRIMLAPSIPADPVEEDWTPPPRRLVPLSWAAAAAVLVSLVVAAVVAVAVGGGDQAGTQAGTQAGPQAATQASSAAPTTASVPARTACAVRYSTDVEDDGAQIEIDIVNTGTTQISGWTLTFELRSGGVRLGDTRNGRWSVSNGRVTVRSVDQNAAIAPGATVASRPTASLVGRSGKRDRVPERFTLNGTNCTILDSV